MHKYLYGIDFGTSNSALSILDETRNEIIETISVPSILFFPQEMEVGDEITYSVGQSAIQDYINDGLHGRFMKSIKRVLPRSSFLETRVGGHRLTAIDLASFIFKDLKSKADEIIGFNCQKAIIGRPVFFDDEDATKDELAQKRLMQAAKKAGFSQVAFQFEPIGAAFAYERSIVKKERVLVADFGGGTSDFTLINLDPNRTGKKDRRKDIVATGGIYIGGDSFDSAFMWDIGTPYFGRGVQYESMPNKLLALPLSFFTNICSWEKMNFFNGQKIKNDLNRYHFLTKNNPLFKNLITLTDNNLGYGVFQAIEKTKIELSHANQSKFLYKQNGIKMKDNISLSRYNQIIQKDLNRIENYLDQFLLSNQINHKELDSIFITGGTSLVQAIQALFYKKFSNIPIQSGDNFMSVAKGLAYSGYLFG
ncbi:MAG: Hsp70 family protein [bacterium]|nr:Hsp70 family protein [bacterium]